MEKRTENLLTKLWVIIYITIEYNFWKNLRILLFLKNEYLTGSVLALNVHN